MDKSLRNSLIMLGVSMGSALVGFVIWLYNLIFEVGKYTTFEMTCYFITLSVCVYLASKAFKLTKEVYKNI